MSDNEAITLDAELEQFKSDLKSLTPDERAVISSVIRNIHKASQFPHEMLFQAMNEIAYRADTARALCLEAIGADAGDSNLHPAQLIDSVRFIVEQIGTIADLHGAEWEGGAAEWMMSPAWKAARPKQEI